jgi:AcrR family transcriptional regulator
MENNLTETQKRILEIGKKEFLLHGFKNASLRGIVKEAGFTQGAFYGYYPDKASLFDALVEPALVGLIAQYKDALTKFHNLIDAENTISTRKMSADYLKHFLGYIYDHFDAFKLILCCSDGTKHANFIHDIVNMEAEETQKYYSKLEALEKVEGTVSKELRHMITSAYFTAIFETVVHDMPRERAYSYIEELTTFFNSGWDGLLKLK